MSFGCSTAQQISESSNAIQNTADASDALLSLQTYMSKAKGQIRYLSQVAAKDSSKEVQKYIQETHNLIDQTTSAIYRWEDNALKQSRDPEDILKIEILKNQFLSSLDSEQTRFNELKSYAESQASFSDTSLFILPSYKKETGIDHAGEQSSAYNWFNQKSTSPDNPIVLNKATADNAACAIGSYSNFSTLLSSYDRQSEATLFSKKNSSVHYSDTDSPSSVFNNANVHSQHSSKNKDLLDSSITRVQNTSVTNVSEPRMLYGSISHYDNSIILSPDRSTGYQSHDSEENKNYAYRENLQQFAPLDSLGINAQLVGHATTPVNLKQAVSVSHGFSAQNSTASKILCTETSVNDHSHQNISYDEEIIKNNFDALNLTEQTQMSPEGDQSSYRSLNKTMLSKKLYQQFDTYEDSYTPNNTFGDTASQSTTATTTQSNLSYTVSQFDQLDDTTHFLQNDYHTYVNNELDDEEFSSLLQQEPMGAESAPLWQQQPSQLDQYVSVENLKGMKKIQYQAQQLMQIFNDFNSVLYKQKVDLDLFDNTMIQIDNTTNGTIGELRLAQKRKQRTRQRQLRCILLLIVLGSVLYIIIGIPHLATAKK